MSSRSPSFVHSTAASEDLLSMSRHSTPSHGAPELAKLSLTGGGSSSGSDSRNTMAVTTRSAAKRAAGSRQLASGAASRSGAASSSSPNVRRSGRVALASSSRRPPDDDDDDDDDESDESDDDDDDDDGEEGGQPAPSQQTPQTQRAIIRQQVLDLFVPFEPSHHSIDEFSNDGTRRGGTSTLFRNRILSVASTLRQMSDLVALTANAPKESPDWSRAMLESMEQRWKNIVFDFKAYKENNNQGVEIPETVDRIKSMFEAIYSTLFRFPNMGGAVTQGHFDIMVGMFEFLVTYSQDVRTQGASTYAGGSTNFEYNLWFRFATNQNNWDPCLTAMFRIGHLHNKKYAPLFPRSRPRWVWVYQTMAVIHQTNLPADSRACVSTYVARLQALGVNMSAL